MADTDTEEPMVTAVLVGHVGWKGSMLHPGAKVRVAKSQAEAWLKNGVVRKQTAEEKDADTKADAKSST